MALEEELRLNIDGALGEVDRLGAVLTQTAQQFSADLAAALDPLQSVQVAVPVTADTTDLTTEVEAAAAAANPTVGVTVDGGEVATEVEAAVVGATPPPVTVTADTSEAQAAVDDLAGSASSALDSVGSTAQTALSGVASTATAAGTNVTSVGGAMGSFGDATNSATGAVQGLASSVGGELDPALGAIIGTIGGVTAAFGTIGAVTDFFVGKATESVSAAQRFDQQFGNLAGSVERFDNLNLGGTLGEVTNQLGSGVTAIRNADSNFAALGNSVGASREQIALTSQQLNALATRAVALNPSLGSVGDVVDQLQARIARGGRFVSQFGLSLNKAEIDARAADVALQRGSKTIEQYDRTVAATQLSVEKLGSRLNTDIATGAQNVAFDFKQLQLEVNKAFTEFGKPLIAPALDVLRAFSPIAVSIGKQLAALARVSLPLIEAGFKAVGPVVEAFAAALEQQLPTILPAIEELARSLVDAFQRFRPTFDELIKQAPFLASAFADMAEASATLLDFLGPLIDGLAFFNSALFKLSPAGFITTIDQIVNGTDTATTSTSQYATQQKEAAAAERQRAQTASSLQATFDGLNAQVAALSTSSTLSTAQVNFLALGIGNLRTKSDVELTAIANRLGVNADAFKTWRDAVVQRIAELTNEVSGKLPSVASIINGLGDNVSPQGLITGLQLSTTAVDNFQKNIETIRQQAGPNVDALIAEILKLGPIVGGKLAQQIVNGGPYLAKSLADQYAALRAANDRLLKYVSDEFGPQFVVSTGGAAQDAATAFGVGLGTMAPEARRQAALASIALLQGFSNIAQTLGVLAPELGAQLSAGIALGVSANLRVVVDSTNEMIQASIAAANAAAGVRSPSTVFATIGGYMVDGLALGLGEQKAAVDAASSLVANVAGAARAQANLSPARLPAGSRIVRFEDGSLGVIRVDASGREFNDVAAARLLTADTERLRAAVNGRLAAPPSGVPPLLQTMFGMTAAGNPTSTVSGAVALWGEQVGNQILRSLANGRLGLTPDQFAGASVKAADVNIGGQRLGALPGNAPVVVNVTAPAGTDPTIAREFGKVVGNEVRSAVVSLRAQVVAS